MAHSTVSLTKCPLLLEESGNGNIASNIWPNIATALLVLFFFNYIKLIILAGRMVAAWLGKEVHPAVDLVERANSPEACIRYLLSLHLPLFNLFRTMGVPICRCKVQPDSHRRRLKRWSASAAVILALLLQLAQLLAGALAIYEMKPIRAVEQTPLDQLKVVKLASTGAPWLKLPQLSEEEQQCFTCGRDGAEYMDRHITKNSLQLVTSRMDAKGTYHFPSDELEMITVANAFLSRDGYADITVQRTPVAGQVSQSPGDDSIFSKEGIHMRLSVPAAGGGWAFAYGLHLVGILTDVQGNKSNYPLYDGNFGGDDSEVHRALNDMAAWVGLTWQGSNLNFSWDPDMEAHVAKVGIQEVQGANTLVDKLMTVYCNVVRVDVVHSNNTLMEHSVATLWKWDTRPPDWFWPMFAVSGLIYLVVLLMGVGAFDDTEVMLMYGMELQQLFTARILHLTCGSLSPPILTLGCQPELGYSTLADGRLHFGIIPYGGHPAQLAHNPNQQYIVA